VLYEIEKSETTSINPHLGMAQKYQAYHCHIM
jgi:hypothetical protein